MLVCYVCTVHSLFGGGMFDECGCVGWFLEHGGGSPLMGCKAGSTITALPISLVALYVAVSTG